MHSVGLILSYFLQFIHAFLWDVCAESNCLSMLKRVFLSPRITRGQLVKSTRSNRSRIVTDTLFCIKGKSTECFLPTPDCWMQLSSISLAKAAVVWFENFMFQHDAKVRYHFGTSSSKLDLPFFCFRSKFSTSFHGRCSTHPRFHKGWELLKWPY